MKNSNTIGKQIRNAFSGGLLGVVLLILLPGNVFAQADSLVLDTTLTGVNLSATAWGDYDNDGDLDLVLTGSTNGTSGGAIAELYDNDGSGNLTKNTTISSGLTGASRSGAAFGDYDNDGYLDLVIIGYNTSNTPTTTLYNNNGDGSFSVVSGTGFDNGAWSSAYWGDINNDGYLDLFLSGLPSNNVRFNDIYVNDKDGTFTNLSTGILPTAGGDFVYGDYDNDGDLDLALVGYTNSSNVQTKFYRNDTGTFNEVSAISSVMLASDHTSLHFVDYDSDGDLDLFNTGGGGARLLVNDGAGNLTNTGPSFTGVSSGSADWADYDLDGDLDLLYNGYTGASNSFFMDNDGDGTFTLNSTYSEVEVETGTTDWVDIDNDGDVDLFITGYLNSSSRTASLYKNYETTNNTAPVAPLLNPLTQSNDTTFFSWNSASDNEGGSISYNIYVYDVDASEYLVYPGSNISTGIRKDIGIGNTGIDTTYYLINSKTNLQWGVQSIDAAGKASAFNVYTPLSSPNNLNAQVSSSKVELSWNTVSDSSLASYRVFSSTDTLISPSVVSTITDTTLTVNIPERGTEYYYAVASIDTNGNQSTLSSYVSVLVPPISVTIDSVQLADFKATIVWNAIDDADFQSFRVYQTTDTTATDSLVATITDTTFTSSYLNRNATYYFRIAALDTNNVESPATSYQAITIPSLQITGFTLQEIGFTAKLSWDSVAAGDFASFKVYQNTDTTGSKTLLTTLSDTTYTTGNLTRGSTYYFTVSIVDSTGTEGPFSEYLSFTLPELTPEGLTLELINSTVKATWNKREEGDVQSYNLYSTLDTTLTSTLLATTTDTTFITDPLNGGITHYFSVSTIDTNDIESEVSNFVGIEIPFNFQLNTSLSNQLIKVASGGSATRHKSDIDWVDYDNDGDLDLSLIGEGGVFSGILLLYNYESSTGFTRDTDFVLNDIILDYGEADWGDYDNDGDLDLLVVGYDDQASENISAVYKNNGDKTFTEIDKISSVLAKNTRANAKWVDIDNDGDLDIFYNGFYFSARSYIYLNNGNDTFVNANYTFNTLWSSSTLNLAVDEGEIQLLDINNDGYVDVTGTGGISIGLRFTGISLNSKNNSFSDSGNSLQGLTDSALEWGDLDADGDPDLVYMGYNYDSDTFLTYIYFNDGSGNLSLHSTLDGYRRGDIALGDIDNDGDLDLIISGLTINTDYSTAGTKVFSNNLSTVDSFIELPGSTLANLGRGNISFADYDQDGDLDIAMNGRNSGGNNVNIYENTSVNTGSAPGKPSNFSLVVKQEEVSITWNAATDVNGGPLHYEAFVLKPDKTPVIYAKSDTSTGFRQVTELGNAGYNNFITLDVASLERGFYTIGVQAIDATGLAGEFAIEQIPIRAYFNPLGISALKDTVTTIPLSTFQKHSFLNDSTLTLSLRSAPNAQLFIDADNDYIMDAGEVKLDSTGFNFSLQASDSLRIYSDTTGFEDIILKIETPSGMVVDSATIQLAMFESAPSISGTAYLGGWYLMGNPLQTTLGKLFENIWTQGAINADTETGTPNLYFFNPDSAKYIAITTDLDTTRAKNGQGILAFIFPDNNYNDAIDPVDGGWPKSLSNYGEPFKVNDPVEIKNTDVDGNGFTSGSEGFALMGNPYGVPVSVDSLIAELIKIDPYANRYVYRWDPIEKQYNLNFTGFVNAYESFFVRTIQSGISGNAVFEYDDVHSSARLKNTPKQHPIELNLFAGDVATGEYALRLAEDALTEIDPFDGYYLGSFASNFANLYSTIGDQPLALNNLPLGLSEVVEIPLFLHSTERGQHRLEWAINEWPEEWTVELENPKTGESINLKDQTSYTFEFANAQLKSKGDFVQTPELFGFHNIRLKAKSTTSDLILRINPGVASANENDLGIPREVELYQNYPNPFNPSSIIRFGVPEQAPVRLEVFDILGRKVMSLLNGEVKQAGRYNIAFDGRVLASGMYIYRLVIGDKVLTKKMTLIK